VRKLESQRPEGAITDRALAARLKACLDTDSTNLRSFANYDPRQLRRLPILGLERRGRIVRVVRRGVVVPLVVRLGDIVASFITPAEADEDYAKAHEGGRGDQNYDPAFQGLDHARAGRCGLGIAKRAALGSSWQWRQQED